MYEPVWKRPTTKDEARIDELRFVRDGSGESGGGRTEIGALVSHAALASDSGASAGTRVLAEACRTVGGPQVRARGTIGGNIANASPAADAAVALLALDSFAVVESAAGGLRREVPLAEFFVGPGKTTLGPDELVTEVAFRSPTAGARSAYFKAGQREALAIAIVSVAVVHEPDAGTVRIAMGSVAPVPVRAVAAEELFAREWEPGKVDDAFVDAVAAEAARAASPIDDIRASARYRTVLTEVLARRALREVCF